MIDISCKKLFFGGRSVRIPGGEQKQKKKPE